MTRTPNRFGAADSDGGYSPPVVDCLVLDDYLGQQITEIKERLHDIRSYVWFAESNYNKAETYCHGAIHASKNGVEDATAFFVDATEDVFHFDKALRASVTHKTPKPVHRNDIPKTLTKQERGGGPYQKIEYRLQSRRFKWSATVPSDASRKAAELMAANPPDAFWIAEYVHQPPPERLILPPLHPVVSNPFLTPNFLSSTYDPIIYASYGLWEVEVARWE